MNRSIIGVIKGDTWSLDYCSCYPYPAKHLLGCDLLKRSNLPRDLSSGSHEPSTL